MILSFWEVLRAEENFIPCWKSVLPPHAAILPPNTPASLTENSAAGRYLLYAIGENVLVVIGILIALQVMLPMKTGKRWLRKWCALKTCAMT